MRIFPDPNIAIPLPKGFSWGTAAAGIRYKNRDDLAVIDPGCEATAAAVFTQNTFCAAPVRVSREILSASKGRIRGVVVNSGCANAATGEQGLRDARAMAEELGKCLAPSGKTHCLVCSTGTIGVRLPMEKVLPAIHAAVANRSESAPGFLAFARAILTTDTREKYAWKVLTIAGKPVTILACAKGSGMIYPRMATLLGFVATDAELPPETAQTLLRYAVNRSLNCLTVDADTSTNDTTILLANGASGASIQDIDSADGQCFAEALTEVLQCLARQLARDGEGATKLIEITVREARSYEEAHQVAMSIANSNLVKTAIYGRDANWGRIVCAIGNTGVSLEPERVRVRLGDLLLFEKGEPVPFDEGVALQVLSEEFVPITVDLGLGENSATAWTCDLTEKYVEINGAYRT